MAVKELDFYAKLEDAEVGVKYRIQTIKDANGRDRIALDNSKMEGSSIIGNFNALLFELDSTYITLMLYKENKGNIDLQLEGYGNTVLRYELSKIESNPYMKGNAIINIALAIYANYKRQLISDEYLHSIHNVGVGKKFPRNYYTNNTKKFNEVTEESYKFAVYLSPLDLMYEVKRIAPDEVEFRRSNMGSMHKSLPKYFTLKLENLVEDSKELVGYYTITEIVTQILYNPDTVSLHDIILVTNTLSVINMVKGDILIK